MEIGEGGGGGKSDNLHPLWHHKPIPKKRMLPRAVPITKTKQRARISADAFGSWRTNGGLEGAP